MADFEAAIRRLLDCEGWDTVTDDPHDAGGLTKYGISKAAYPHLDIANLSLAEAVQIYRADYWGHRWLRCDALECQALAEEVFLFGVNAGQWIAATVLQRAYNWTRTDRYSALVEDGWIGPKSIGAINTMTMRRRSHARAVEAAFVVLIGLFYAVGRGRFGDLWDRDLLIEESRRRYVRGWLNRPNLG